MRTSGPIACDEVEALANSIILSSFVTVCSGERRLPACSGRQLVGYTSGAGQYCLRLESLCDGVSASCRDVQAGSLRSPSMRFVATNEMRYEGELEIKPS